MPGGGMYTMVYSPFGQSFFLCMSIIFNIFNTLFTFCSEIYDILTYSAPGGVSINLPCICKKRSGRSCRCSSNNRRNKTMNENKDYVSHLNKARKKRNQKWDPRYLLLAIVVVLLIGLGVLAAVNVKSAVSGKAARKSDNVIEEPGTGLEAASASNAAREEEEKAKEEQEIQSAIDAYQNLGIVQVSGYVNIRETPDMKGNIIGKVSGDGACEVLGEEGEWSHITSGGIEGYISSQYLVTGEEAKELAKVCEETPLS